jgi:hypothetical protein
VFNGSGDLSIYVDPWEMEAARLEGDNVAASTERFWILAVVHHLEERHIPYLKFLLLFPQSHNSCLFPNEGKRQ